MGGLIAPPQGFGWAPPTVYAELASTYTTSNTTPTSTGFGVTFTAPPSGKAMLDMACVCDAAPTQTVAIYLGAAIPAVGQPPGPGDTVLYSSTWKAAGAGTTWSGGAHPVLAGLTPGQTYAVYAAVWVTGSGSVSLLGGAAQTTIRVTSMP
jgi:hypothetical protein